MKLADLPKPFVIAEIGSNWHNLEECLHAIWAAKNCGADAIKFQLYTHEELYGFPGEVSHELPPEWLPKLKAHAFMCDIEFMCTAFSPKGIATVDPYVEIHKLASSENNHVLMHKALKETDKPIIISLGATTIIEKKMIYETFLGFDTAYLYCVANYPAQEIHLESIREIQKQTGAVTGFSDHSTDYSTIPVSAVTQYGAAILEKHFNPLNHTDTPDAPHSIGQEQFKTMTAKIHGKFYGHGEIRSEELAMEKNHKRRLVMKKDSKKGEELHFDEHYGIYRFKGDSLVDVKPYFYADFDGARLKKPKKQGDTLGPDDIEGTTL